MSLPQPSFWRKAADSIAIKLMERFGVVLVLLIVGYMLTTGKSMVEGVWDSKVEHTMRPKFDAESRRVDTLAREVTDIKIEVESISQNEREFFGAQMDLDPEFRRAVEARVARKQARQKQKKESEEVLNNLLKHE